MIGDIGKRAARERPLGFNDGVAFEEGDDVCERSAAQDVDNERIRCAFVLPGLGFSRRNRRADRLQLNELSRVRGFVALGDLKLKPLQVIGQFGQVRGSANAAAGERRASAAKANACRSALTASPRAARISIRRFSAARG